VQEPVAAKDWEGAEYWMPLAWELCANECGEEACTELVWEGGPIPEPWGERWLKYEDEAKSLIALVQKHTTQPAAQPAVPEGWQLIETAPQDGTKILGWNEEFGARETQMNFYGEGSLGFAAWKSGKGPKENGWNWSEPKSNWGHTWKPTHWKPLLTPCNTTTPNVATPPAAQRQWVGLDDDDISALGLSIAKARALESLLKRRNT
jgi:hypothetical protein